MKRYRLSRGEARRLQNDDGSLAEELAADEYAGFQRDFQDADWYDLTTTGGGYVECKSTFTRLESGAKGRFRLWKTQHEQLVEHDRDDGASAWYCFVLWNVDGRDIVARFVRKKPAEIGRSIGARGGWNESGHTMGPQYKLPYAAVFD
jgi:hypothetical protein